MKNVLIVIVFMTLNQGKLKLHWGKTNKFLCVVNSISRQSVSSDSFICSDFFFKSFYHGKLIFPMCHLIIISVHLTNLNA